MSGGVVENLSRGEIDASARVSEIEGPDGARVTQLILAVQAPAGTSLKKLRNLGMEAVNGAIQQAEAASGR